MIPIAPDALRPPPSLSSRRAARVTTTRRVALGDRRRTSEAIGRALCAQRRLSEQKIRKPKNEKRRFKKSGIFNNPVLGGAVLTHHCCLVIAAIASAPGLLRPPPALSGREGARAARMWRVAVGGRRSATEAAGGAL